MQHTLPSLEITVEGVPLPKDLSTKLTDCANVAISSKDYSTVPNTWGFSVIEPDGDNLIDIIREDFTDGISFQKVHLSSEVLSFAQSVDGQSVLYVDKSCAVVIIRRNKESSRTIELLPRLFEILRSNPLCCSRSNGGFMAISNDSKLSVFYPKNCSEIFVYLDRAKHKPSWISLKLQTQQAIDVSPNNIACRFIQCDTGLFFCSIAVVRFTKSTKTNEDALEVSSFLIRPLLEESHFLSRPQCSEVKQQKFIFPIKSFGSALCVNNQPGSLVLSVSQSGNILALVLNQNQFNRSKQESRLIFLGLRVKAVVVCRLESVLKNEEDCVTCIEWVKSDLLCAVCTAKGRFAIYACASGILQLVCETSSESTPSANSDPLVSMDLLQTEKSKMMSKNSMAVHVSEPVILCYSLNQAFHVLLRSVPQRVKIVRDYVAVASEYLQMNDKISAARLNLSAWGMIVTSSEQFHERQINVIRQLSTQSFEVSSSLISSGSNVTMNQYLAFVEEMKNLLGFTAYSEDSFSMLAETIILSIVIAFDKLLPASISKGKIGSATYEMLVQMYRMVNSLDNDIRQCLKHLDASIGDVTVICHHAFTHFNLTIFASFFFLFQNIQISGDSKGKPAKKSSNRNTISESFPVMSWALNFYERLYLECCKRIAMADNESLRNITLVKYRPLIQKIQASCALICPVSKCNAALADFKVSSGVDNFLDGNINGALETWSTTLLDIFKEKGSRSVQRNLFLTFLYALLTSGKAHEAVLLGDFAAVSILCPVRRRVEFNTEDEKEAYLKNMSDLISELPRMDILMGSLADFIGSIAAVIARWFSGEPICIPPVLEPQAASYEKLSAKAKENSRLVCLDPSSIAKCLSLGIIDSSKILFGMPAVAYY